MKKLMKSQETLTVQAGTNASCSCKLTCGYGESHNVIYKDIQRDNSATGNTPYSYKENE